jgi:hypothetical protein
MNTCIDALALVNNVKIATFQYSNGPHGQQNKPQPVGKTIPATYSTAPLKGQKITPVKHSDVPVELRSGLRRKSSAAVAKLMDKAGGPTAVGGDAYAAILEGRGINPNLARDNLSLARAVPNDIFRLQSKTASRLRKIIG